MHTEPAKVHLGFQAELIERMGGRDRITATKMAVIEATAILRFRVHDAIVKYVRGEATDDLDGRFVTVQRALVQNCCLLGLDATPEPPLTLDA